ncbi:MAG: dihydrolipoamide acetyltransferase family protein [Rhodocyclaceae bacterium]
MGVHVIKMPDIGEGIAEVELVAWHVKPGDAVIEDQQLAEVMTDKATVEIPSPVAGRVLALGGVPGQVMAVGAELIRIEVEGAGNVKAAAAPQPAEAAGRRPEAEAPVPPPPREQSSPAAQPGRARALEVPPAGGRRPGEKPLASPAVRSYALERGVDLRIVAGSGPAGRILRADVDAFLAGGARAAPQARGGPYAKLEGEEAIPVIGLRRRIAQRMQESKRRIPHFTYVEEVDATELEALRAALNAKHEGSRVRLTLLPLILRAIVVALREFPQINARFDDEAGVLTRYRAVHAGIATQTDSGLMVPVLRHAEARDPWEAAAEIARLSEAARAGRAGREELTGSTITITSLGALGGIVSTPVINPPEVAIVGINRMVERPVIREGRIAVRRMMNLSSSFDHRVVDGMDAARFIQALRALLEAPATLFVE